MGGRRQLDETRERLTQWRQRYGGPGVPVPADLWEEAVEVARVEGVEATARALRLDRLRLKARIEDGRRPEVTAVGGGFVELDASRLGLSSRTIIRLVGRDGERLEIEIGGGASVDVGALVEAFWRRPI